MARYRGSVHKLCRREGVKLCDSPKCPVEKKGPVPPGQHGLSIRRRKSDYGTQLREKQKVKSIYRVLEKQFANYFKNAQKATGNTGERLLQILETRLDNTVYRLGLAQTRPFARQLVNHGLVRVNDRKIDVPSYAVKEGDIITLKERALNLPLVKESMEGKRPVPSWLSRKGPVGKVERLPLRDDVGQELNVQLIIEFYSR